MTFPATTVIDDTPKVAKRKKPPPTVARATPPRPAGPPRSSSRCSAWLWMVPIFGTFVTSFRPLDDANSSGWWTVFTHPVDDLGNLTFDNYTKAIESSNMGQAFINSLAITLPATFIPILIAAFAAYAFTFMEFWGRDFLFLAIVSLLVVPNYVAFVPMLKIYGEPGHERHVPGGVARAHRVRHVAGHLHPAQLHGHPAQDRDRVGQDRRRQPLPDVLQADPADVGARAGVVRDLPVPLGVERPAGRAGVHRPGHERAGDGRPHRPPARASARAGSSPRPAASS